MNLLTAFKLLRLTNVTIATWHDPDDRDAIQSVFNQGANEAQILIVTHAVGATGLNLEQRCCRVHLFESTHNLGILAQALSRTLRIGIPRDSAFVYEYFTVDTFDDKTVQRNIEKAVPQAFAELNGAKISGGDEHRR